MEKLSRIFYKVPRRIQKGLTIVSHNVFWFQGAPFLTDQPPAPRPEILQRLCEMYRTMRPDVLCLQEIQGESVARTVAETLDMAHIYRRGGNYPQYGGAVFSRRPLEEIAFAQDVSIDRVSLGVAVHFPEGPALRLANVHLPSGRQRGAEGGQKQRLLELSAVAGQVDLLLGDYNETPNGQSAAFLKERGYVDVAETCGAGDEPSNVIAAGYRGDMIWIAEKMAGDLQGYFVVPKEKLAIDEREKTFLSDHLPVGCFVRL
jgi:exonuclease III